MYRPPTHDQPQDQFKYFRVGRPTLASLASLATTYFFPLRVLMTDVQRKRTREHHQAGCGTRETRGGLGVRDVSCATAA